ncbi:hypothetical protein SAMN04488087_1812 [Rhodothermus profundi]|uniref:Uncharacterized protein n=1 Tax=Rhodothermus profundi TaxID=633813 RepID=A0A1M6UQ97_9BACT|nr:hypothetical protein SAMN04488087_1812 [Rhodothermus profundi]
MRPTRYVLLICALPLLNGWAQDEPRLFQFRLFSRGACPCPPGEVLTQPPVDRAMIRTPRTRYHPHIRLVRPAPAVQPHFRNLACRPLRQWAKRTAPQRPERWLKKWRPFSNQSRQNLPNESVRFIFPSILKQSATSAVKNAPAGPT